MNRPFRCNLDHMKMHMHTHTLFATHIHNIIRIRHRSPSIFLPLLLHRTNTCPLTNCVYSMVQAPRLKSLIFSWNAFPAHEVHTQSSSPRFLILSSSIWGSATYLLLGFAFSWFPWRQLGIPSSLLVVFCMLMCSLVRPLDLWFSIVLIFDFFVLTGPISGFLFRLFWILFLLVFSCVVQGFFCEAPPTSSDLLGSPRTFD